MSDIALRPYLPADAPLLIAIFRAAIEELTGDEYDEDQRAAWAASADDEEAFAHRLAEALTIVAVLEGQPVGFASLRDNREIDMLYVHPDAAGMGAATALIDALEKLAGARGAQELSGEISDTARGFFERRGFVAQTRNTVLRNGEWLATTTMKKTLADKGVSTTPPTRH